MNTGKMKRWNRVAETGVGHVRFAVSSKRRGRGGRRDLSVGDREAHADGQCGELIDRVAAGTPVGKLLLIEALGEMRLPFAGYRPDHGLGVELAAIDAHRAAEAAADIERGLDDGVAGKARRDRLEMGDFPGRDAAGYFRSSSLGQVRANPQPIWDETAQRACVLRSANGTR
jgi:hypothetical protein